jgi:hypothetical protein
MSRRCLADVLSFEFVQSLAPATRKCPSACQLGKNVTTIRSVNVSTLKHQALNVFCGVRKGGVLDTYRINVLCSYMYLLEVVLYVLIEVK